MSEISQISCQLSFYPLGAADYNQIVEQVLQLIQQQTAVTAETNELATILRGPVTDIFKLLEQIMRKNKIGILSAMQLFLILAVVSWKITRE